MANEDTQTFGTSLSQTNEYRYSVKRDEHIGETKHICFHLSLNITPKIINTCLQNDFNGNKKSLIKIAALIMLHGFLFSLIFVFNTVTRFPRGRDSR